jgi:hypothetical protein
MKQEGRTIGDERAGEICEEGKKRGIREKGKK